ncbi:MAG TPA: four-carbon acid sugar kinase family protein [Trebonia sp.]|nr:four-carbon acid sugar kinase family protein [Trebonia sp.]
MTAGILAGLPPARPVGAAEVALRVAASGRVLVVLDDDPTGTQAVAGIPVLTQWTVPDLRWAFDQAVPAFFVLTNTRALPAERAAARNREVIRALVTAAGQAGARFAVASRGDSTLRGHYPLETDAIASELRAAAGTTVDGVILVPAYLDAGRLTVGGVHWVRGPGGLVPVGETEFARDPSFGFRSSHLGEYVEEKTGGRWRAGDVPAISLAGLRTGSMAALVATLTSLEGGMPVIVDAASEDDLRMLALAAMAAEAAGKTLVYRCGPSFVRARAGLEPRPPLGAADLAAIRDQGGALDAGNRDAAAGTGPRAGHGLVIVGSHVGQTTRQLGALSRLGDLTHLELDVPAVLAAGRQPDAAGRLAALAAGLAVAAAGALARTDVVLTTSRAVAAGADSGASLAIARAVSDAVVAVARGVVSRVRPAWIIAKGGITSSEVATAGLGVRRAWARGTLLPGIVSVWDPVDSRVPGTPYVVFAGNVGDEGSLAAAVTALRSGEA